MAQDPFEFLCPHCSQPLECSFEHIGYDVTCLLCGGDFIVPAPEPPPAKPVDRQVRHCVVDARILISRAPPRYVQMLVEMPKVWILQQDGALPAPAAEAVTKALRVRFPQCPVTPIKVRNAEPESLRRISEQTDYSDDCCKAWYLGRASA